MEILIKNMWCLLFKDKLRENTYISGLLTTVVFNKKTGEVENKILDLNGLVKQTDYDAKISDIGIK